MMETNNGSVYRLSIGFRILMIGLMLGFGLLSYNIIFGGNSLNFLILDALGIRLAFVSMCLNVFFLLISVAVIGGGILMLVTKTELTISENALRYVSGKIDRELKWDTLERVNMIAQDNGAMKNRTLEFYEKSDPTKVSLSVTISFMEKRDEIITKVEKILSAGKVPHNF